MKKYLIAILASFFMVSCQGQDGKIIKAEENDKALEEPKGSWKVNREFDENGNLIRYDSIYSYSSNDIEGFESMDRDSIFQSFRSHFSRSFSSSPNFPEEFFEDDSLFMNKFFANDFFESEFGKDFMDLDRMQKRMEAMQQKFFQRHFKELDEPEKETEKI